jgi:hypothetical protein
MVALAAMGTSTASADTTTSNKVDVALTAQVLQTLTLVVAVPTVAFGVVTPGQSNTAPLGQAVSVVSAWSLASGVTMKLYAYFDTASSAMTGTLTGTLVPTSAFTGSVNGGAQASFTQTNPFGGAALALQMYSVGITAANLIGARTDTLALTMNLTGISLVSDTYSGTMHVQAQAL